MDRKQALSKLPVCISPLEEGDYSANLTYRTLEATEAFFDFPYEINEVRVSDDLRVPAKIALN